MRQGDVWSSDPRLLEVWMTCWYLIVVAVVVVAFFVMGHGDAFFGHGILVNVVIL